jgi:hypothetical protein
MRTLPDAIAQIQNFHKVAPLQLYLYPELINLIEGAQNCPPDTVFELLLIAGDMFRGGNLPERKDAKTIAAIIGFHLQNRTVFPSFPGGQAAARAILHDLRALFKNAGDPPPRPALRFRTRDLERVVEEQRVRSEAGRPRMTDGEARAFLLGEAPAGGADSYESMDEEHRHQIDELARALTHWETAYDWAKRIWAIMKEDPAFDVNVLITRIQFSFADFLVRAIQAFMSDEGIDV